MNPSEMMKKWAEKKTKLDKYLTTNQTPTVRVVVSLPEEVFTWLSTRADKYGKSIEETVTLIISREAYKAMGGNNGNVER